VLIHASGVHECLQRSRSLKTPERFVFVPSSRMHPELSDDDLFSGQHMLCTIVCAPPSISNSLMTMRAVLTRYHQRKVCPTPEDTFARRLLVVREFPGWTVWKKRRLRVSEDMVVDLGISAGAPFREMTDEEHLRALDDESADVPMYFGPYASDDILEMPEPWGFEERVWLPSVPLLHEFYRLARESTIPWEIQMIQFHTIFDTLQTEYTARLSGNDACGLQIPSDIVRPITEAFQ
jgi:hypothetical protein